MDEKQPSVEGSVFPAMSAWVAWEGKRSQMFSSSDKIQLFNDCNSMQMKLHSGVTHEDIEMETQMLSCKGSRCCVCLKS